MKLNDQIQFPANTDVNLKSVLYAFLQATARKVNGMASGKFSDIDGYSVTVPASGTWAIGDFIRKQTPVEAGVPTAKYVVWAWLRLTNGSANVLNTDWVEVRFLTGN